MTKRWPNLILLIIIVVLLATLPMFLGPYWLRIATGAVMWAGLACSWNIIGGYAGYIDFGHSAFFGIGAYATAIFMGDSFGWPFLATIQIGRASCRERVCQYV